MLVRARAWETMSRYLIRCIEELPNVTRADPHPVVALEGSGPAWSGCSGGTTRPARRRRGTSAISSFMIGADPNTTWLRGCVALDDKGFVKTGNALAPKTWPRARWPWDARPIRWRRRSPASSPRATSARARQAHASAVGEAAACIQLVHKALQE